MDVFECLKILRIGRIQVISNITVHRSVRGSGLLRCDRSDGAESGMVRVSDGLVGVQVSAGLHQALIHLIRICIHRLPSGIPPRDAGEVTAG
ncbi:MAG TPA: hypothetical protein PLS90_06385 [Candidatus Sumerlaeota bacterium]|nr:hypothetical protein [Candidatus Sumerlaeota bacterium]